MATSLVHRERLLPRLAAAPRVISRSSRRLTMAGFFALETVRAIRRELGTRWTLADAEQRLAQMTWFSENMCALHGVRVEVEGRIPTSPVVLAANHLGYMDPLVILTHVRGCPIAKVEVCGWPLIGEAAASLGVMMVDRDDPYSGARVLRRCLSVLDAGISVLAFPEGTTSTGRGVLPMRRGVFGIARIAGVPIVPVGLSYDSPDMAWVGDTFFLPHYVRTTARASTRARLVFGDPIAPGSDARATADEAREQIERLIRR